MAKKKTMKKESKCKIGSCMSSCSCDTSCIGYGLGVIGAAVYFISQATGFWVGVLGVLKALVWPAFLVHGLLKFLGL